MPKSSSCCPGIDCSFSFVIKSPWLVSLHGICSKCRMTKNKISQALLHSIPKLCSLRWKRRRGTQEHAAIQHSQFHGLDKSRKFWFCVIFQTLELVTLFPIYHKNNVFSAHSCGNGTIEAENTMMVKSNWILNRWHSRYLSMKCASIILFWGGRGGERHQYSHSSSITSIVKFWLVDLSESDQC